MNARAGAGGGYTCPRTAQRLYHLLLQAYPREFRAKYGREMVLLFRELCGESEVRSLRFWAGMVGDVVRSAPALHVDAWRRMRRTRTIEVLMKVAALLTLLLGFFATLNAVAEGVSGLRGTMAGIHLLAVGLGVLAGGLLLTSGVTLLRSASSARRVATAATLASLVLLVVARLLHPWMSLFSQLVGIALPVALLIVLHWRRRPSASRTG